MGSSEHQKKVCEALTLRHLYSGNFVIPESHRERVKELQSLISLDGFTQEMSLSREKLFVPNIFSYTDSFEHLREFSLSRSVGIRLMPYQHSHEFTELAEEYGLKVIGPEKEGREVARFARSKRAFLDFAKNFPFGNLVPYPRVTLRMQSKDYISSRSAAKGESKGNNFSEKSYVGDLPSDIREAVWFSLRYLKDSINKPSRFSDIENTDIWKVLFVRLGDGAGGFGNFTVSARCPSSFNWLKEADALLNQDLLDEFAWIIHNPDMSENRLNGFNDLIAWLWHLCENADVEIAPFLEILTSFSVASIIGKDTYACMGRVQILNELNPYVGYLWPQERLKSEFQEHFQQAVKFQLYLSSRLKYRHFITAEGQPLTQGVDFAVIRMPGSQTEELIAVECNCRKQAPQFTESAILSMDPWLQYAAENSLVPLGNDHLKCPEEFDTPALLRAFLAKHGFPISSYSNPFGLRIISAYDGEAIGLFTGRSETHALGLMEHYHALVEGTF